MLVFSDAQFGQARQARFAQTCTEIAAELRPHRPPDLEQQDFENLILDRAEAHRVRYRLEQRRHLKLLCYWELVLGTGPHGRFDAFRAEGLDASLDGPGTEAERVERAVSRLKTFLGAGTAV